MYVPSAGVRMRACEYDRHAVTEIAEACVVKKNGALYFKRAVS